MDEVLTSITLERYTTILKFESGSSVTAFSYLRFYDANREEISAFDVSATEMMHVPFHRFVGQALANIQELDGKVELSFGVSGTICVERVGDEPEVALIMFDGDMRVVV